MDADLANNAVSWQWIAGSSVDAAPYSRVFNPVLQGREFDPEGDYVRRYVPELAKLDACRIHAPWKRPGASCVEQELFWGRPISIQSLIWPRAGRGRLMREYAPPDKRHRILLLNDAFRVIILS